MRTSVFLPPAYALTVQERRHEVYSQRTERGTPDGRAQLAQNRDAHQVGGGAQQRNDFVVLPLDEWIGKGRPGSARPLS